MLLSRKGLRHFPRLMPAEARITKLWTQQKGLIPFMFIAFGLYFTWDGLVGYPRSDERWHKHEELKATPGAWEKLCAERGWKTTPPEHEYGPTKVREQYFFGGLTGLVGIFSLIYWLRQRTTVIRNDEEALFSPSGTRVPYSAITEVDARRWKSKGLATVRYTLDGGKGKFVLDDAKWDPDALEIVMRDIRERAPEKVMES